MEGRKIQLIATILISFIIFCIVLISGISNFSKAVFGALVLFFSGLAIKKITGCKTYAGFLIFEIKEGRKIIAFMKKVFGGFWDFVCDLGLFFAFGLCSWFLFKSVRKVSFFVLALLVYSIFIFFIFPNISSFVFFLMEVQIPKTAAVDIFSMAYAVISYAFGLVGITVFSLAQKGIENFLLVLQGERASPGVTFVIPGITLPLIEGIAAIILLMIFHEGGHAIAAILSKIKINSSGIITLGFIPVGAFVDIDEKKLEKVDKVKKARVCVAGSAGNFLATAIFFIPALILFLAFPYFYSDRVRIAAVSDYLDAQGIKPNMILQQIENVQIKNLSDFSRAMEGIKSSGKEEIKIVVNGEEKIIKIKKDEINLVTTQELKDEFWYIKSLFAFFALSAMLNLFIGMINLLPVFSFDGYRLFETFTSKKILDAISWTIVALLALNIFPWVFKI
jgi:membrane-associated protease RseP (regulator of RpoE activity)